MERIKEILMNPVTAILKAKKERNLNKTILIMILSWVLISISFFLSFYNVTIFLIAFSSALAIFLLGNLFTIFLSYVVDITMSILGGKGKYYESLTATTYSSLPISIGLLLTSILSFIHPALGMVLGFIVIAITTALSLSIYFRAIKEFYSTDMMMAFIGFLIIFYVFMISIYISTAFSMGPMLFSNLLPKFGV